MKRRDVLKSALAGAATLAMPAIVRAEAQTTLKFAPHADLAIVDPIFSIDDITRNYGMAAFDTLYGFDADYQPHPQMVAGHTVSSDGKEWNLTLRDGLRFHDGSPVLARDCIQTIRRWGKRDAMGSALLARTDELSAASDKVIRFRLKQPFGLLPTALAQFYCPIMPEWQSKTDLYEQVKDPIGSGPFRFMASERISGSRLVFERNPDYVPRGDGVPSFTAGPKIVHFDRVVWDFIPDPGTAMAALQRGEIDWWENPSIDLVSTLKGDEDLTIAVKDRSGLIGCLRFNHLWPPFDSAAIRNVVLRSIDQKEVMTAVAGAEPSLYQTDLGIFVRGTPMASDVGVEITRGPKDYDKLKQELVTAGYKGERIVILAGTTIPTVFAEAQVATDALRKIGMNIDFQVLDWGAVVKRRTNRDPVDKGGWSIFYTNLNGAGNIFPGPRLPLRGNGANAWFGWPTNPKMEELREAWFAAPDLAAQQKVCRDMQMLFWQDPPYVPLGVYFQPTAYHKNLRDVRDGFPQMYGVRRV